MRVPKKTASKTDAFSPEIANAIDSVFSNLNNIHGEWGYMASLENLTEEEAWEVIEGVVTEFKMKE